MLSRRDEAEATAVGAGDPGRRRQTWYCSVSLRLERRAMAGGASTSGPRGRGLREGSGACLRAWPSIRLDEPVVVDAARRQRRRRCRPGSGRGGTRRASAARSRTDHLGRAEHRPAEGMARRRPPCRRDRRSSSCGRVLDHGDLLEHDLALGVEVGEGGREDHVRHHVERRLEMLVEHAGVHDRVVAGRWRRSARRRTCRRSRRCRAPSRTRCP